MKTIKLLFVATVLFSLTSNAQITKGNWMVGGDGSFSANKSSDDSTSNILNLSPNIGYFILNKASIGAKFNYYVSTSKYQDTKTRTENTDIGPFIRYYFLKEEKRTNLFLETSYNFSLSKENKNTVFATKAGLAIFLNSSVAIETSLKYSRNKYKYNDLIPESSTDGFTIGIGFQIHLEKNK
jgi:outer membrane protein